MQIVFYQISQYLIRQIEASGKEKFLFSELNCQPYKPYGGCPEKSCRIETFYFSQGPFGNVSESKSRCLFKLSGPLSFLSCRRVDLIFLACRVAYVLHTDSSRNGALQRDHVPGKGLRRSL